MITVFIDMHTKGYTKHGSDFIIVTAPEEKAIRIFTAKFQDPEYVTCDCCGPDYAVHEYDSIQDFMNDDVFKPSKRGSLVKFDDENDGLDLIESVQSDVEIFLIK